MWRVDWGCLSVVSATGCVEGRLGLCSVVSATGCVEGRLGLCSVCHRVSRGYTRACSEVLRKSQHPSIVPVYPRDVSAQTIGRAATLRKKLQIKLPISVSYSILKPGQPVRALTL